MQHQDAIRTHAAERYVLGEMAPAEREAYEEHYFACAACADELSATVTFVDNAAAVASSGPGTATRARRQEAPATMPRERWWRRLLTAPPSGLVPALGAAVVVLVAVAAYQGFAVIPGLRQQLQDFDAAQSVPTVAMRTAARGAGPVLTVGPQHAYVVLQADLLPAAGVSRYTAALSSANGREQFRTSVPAPALGMPVTLLVPVRDLAPGDYTLVFREDGGAEAGRFIFTLARQ